MPVTAISTATPYTTNYGPVGGALRKNVTAISMGVNASAAPGVIGAPIKKSFGLVATVAASVANVEQSRIKLESDTKFNSVVWSVQAAAGTASFDIIDITNANAQVIASVALAAGAQASGEVTAFSSATETILAKGTVLALRATTAAASSITALLVEIAGESLATASGQNLYV